MFRLCRERTIEGNEIRLAKDSIEVDEGYPEFVGKRWADIGIVSNEMHVKWLGEAENFRADVADADRPKDTADQTDPVIFEALIESLRTLPRQPVLDEQPAAK